MAGTLGLTVFAFTCGSSGVSAIRSVGSPGRWAALFALCGLSLLLAATRRGTALPSPGFCVLVAAFLALAFVSSTWSMDARLSVEKAVSLAVLFVTVGSLGAACAGRPETIRILLLGILGGAVAVAVAGLLLAAVDYSAATQTLGQPGDRQRFRGIGENPNTASLLFALVLPLALWLAGEARSPRRRAGAEGILVLLLGSIAVSDSHGALAASLAALVLFVWLTHRGWWRVAASAAILAVFLVAFGVSRLAPTARVPASPPSTPAPAEQGAAAQPKAAPTPPAGAKAAVRSAGAAAAPRLKFVHNSFDVYEVGRQRNGTAPTRRRVVFGTSGRAQAWRGAFDQASERPLLGYGFGTESRVFVDRYYAFEGGTPENSYLGIFLQLGAAGVVGFLSIAVALAAIGVRTLRRLSGAPRRLAAAALSVVAAGYVVAVVQSYIYAVGNIATVSFWTAAFLLAAMAAPLRRRPAREERELENEVAPVTHGWEPAVGS